MTRTSADTSAQPVLYWVRRDFRLHDNPALVAATDRGRPVIPVFLLDEVAEGQGACPRWRLGLGAEQFARTLEGRGSRLIFRRGRAEEVLSRLAAETGATAIHFARAYDKASRARDRRAAEALEKAGVEVRTHAGHLLHLPWEVETKTGGFYKVYTPFWRAVGPVDIPAPLSAPSDIPAPPQWPASDDPADWALDAAMDRGAKIVLPWLRVGEDAALGRLGSFIATGIDGYDRNRDLVAADGTSNLSENLTYGEISPRTCWHAGLRARDEGKAGAETFLKELVWREFAYHLTWHFPDLAEANWRDQWDDFPWNEDERRSEVIAWKRGRTGIPFVDAAMREMYVTGRMHNRSRMIVASYLTKHLLCHWRIGLKWFEDCLADWDPASNAMGWQWSAGSGPDATPYFRVFNPETQLGKFDRDGAYTDRWLAEGREIPTRTALSYFDAVPQGWSISPEDPYPQPVIGVSEGRQRALEAYEGLKR